MTPMSLRKRIEKSEFLAACIGWVAGAYLTLCYRTSSWQHEGLEELKTAIDEGPILLVTWHSRSMMAAVHWPVERAQLSSLHNNSPIGRVVGALHRRSGLKPMEMSRKMSNRAASRTVLRRVKEGVSIGMTADGPLGPPLLMKDAPLEWARTTGLPVFCYAFSSNRSRRMSSWDKLLVPKPFGKGTFVFARAGQATSRKMTPEALEALRSQLQTALTQATHRADALAGVPPGP